MGAFPHVDAANPGWLNQVKRLMSDDAHYAAFLAPYVNTTLQPAPGAYLEDTGAFHCQWHDLRCAPPP